VDACGACPISFAGNWSGWRPSGNRTTRSTKDCQQTGTIRAGEGGLGTGAKDIRSLQSGRAADVLVSGDDDGRVSVWDSRQGRQIDQLLIGDLVYSVSLSVCSRRRRVWHEQRLSHFMESDDAQAATYRSGKKRFYRCSALCAHLKDWKVLGMGRARHFSFSYDLNTKTMLSEMTGRDESVERIFSVDDGKILATVLNDGIVRFWNLDTGRPQSVLQLPNREAKRVSVTPAGVVMSVDDPFIQIWAHFRSVSIAPDRTAPLRADARIDSHRGNRIVPRG
jgi:WD40 repeat protein